MHMVADVNAVSSENLQLRAPTGGVDDWQVADWVAIQQPNRLGIEAIGQSINERIGTSWKM